MLQIVLYQPEIPPNTGNVIRLCANMGAGLHLVEPLGFRMEEKALRRAGLDYHEFVDVKLHADWRTCAEHLSGRRIFALSTRNSTTYTDVRFASGDVLLFGPETRGLPAELLAEFPPTQRLRLPMCAGQRSLNLSNAVAVVAYEAWRQLSFVGAGATMQAP
jgi:tRNA (cytidine/uridine-2'-O-)-methyltransferase